MHFSKTKLISVLKIIDLIIVFDIKKNTICAKQRKNYKINQNKLVNRSWV